MNPERMEPEQIFGPESEVEGGSTISELGIAQLEALEKLNRERAEKKISDEEYDKRLAELLGKAMEFSKKAEAPASESGIRKKKEEGKSSS